MKIDVDLDGTLKDLEEQLKDLDRQIGDRIPDLIHTVSKQARSQLRDRAMEELDAMKASYEKGDMEAAEIHSLVTKVLLSVSRSL